MSKSNIKNGLELLKAKFLGRISPFYVQLSVTDRCDSKCIYCWANFAKRGYSEMTLGEVKQVVDELSDLGTWRINLVGGEPLLRSDIGKIISHIKSRKIDCTMTTNGHFIPEKIGEIKDIDLLCVSLDGDEKTHDLNRGKGSYQKAIAGIEAAEENNIPLQFATVITKNNLESINHLMELGKRYNVLDGFAILVNQTTPDGKVMCGSLASEAEYHAVMKALIERKRRGEPILFSEKSMRFSLAWPLGYEQDKVAGTKPRFKHPKCFAGRYYCYIDTDGRLYPCPLMVGIFDAKNCMESGVKEAFYPASKHDCKTCHSMCNNEFNYLFGLDPQVMFNNYLNYRRGYLTR
ncbi:MAG: radical SAM protein [Candidatus Altiarchaeota archaeon]